MAYLDFASNGLGVAVLQAKSSTAALSELEQTAIAIGAHDALSSLGRHGRWSQRVRSIFGVRSVLPLADPKLEALRRLVVAAHFGTATLAANHAAEALRYGISSKTVRALLERFGQADVLLQKRE